jgi:uncharacterized protein YecT (DUF1311 family)
MKTFYLKNIIILCFIQFSLITFSQDNEMYVPLEISYFPGYKFRIPWEEELYKDTWINILTYPLTNPRQANELYVKNRELYNKLKNRMLFSRQACDSLVRDYVQRNIEIERRYQAGEGLFYDQELSGDRSYSRCVCIPARELMDLGHGDAVVVGIPIKYIEPKDFVFKFKRYGLDSLDLAEAPYFTIFPMDINPSFDCSKASTPVEKAICRDAELAKLDKELSQLYAKVLETQGEKVKESQRAWLAERDKQCKGKDNKEIIRILKELYKSRIDELQK